jgi:ribonuclease P protein component
VTRARGFPPGARLRDAADFTALRRDGKRLPARFFQTRFRMTDAGARLGMAVSRRVSKRAVVRNRIRRQIRESFRLHRADLPDCDVLVVAQAAAAAQAGASLRHDLDDLWARLSALKARAPVSTIAPHP